jgi:hypothetical protein
MLFIYITSFSAQLTPCLRNLARNFKTEPTETEAFCFGIPSQLILFARLGKTVCLQLEDTYKPLIYNIFSSIDTVFSLPIASFQNKSYWDSAFCFGIADSIWKHSLFAYHKTEHYSISRLCFKIAWNSVYYSIVYGSILPPFPNNWAAIVGWHGRWLHHFSKMVLPPHTLLPLNCQNREIRME